MTFGLACSPFLANRTLKQLARDEAAKYPLGSQILEKEIYADDVLSGDFTLAGAKTKQEQVISLLHSGRFNLRKWLANNVELIKWLPKDSLNGGQSQSRFRIFGVRYRLEPFRRLFLLHLIS